MLRGKLDFETDSLELWRWNSEMPLEQVGPGGHYFMDLCVAPAEGFKVPLGALDGDMRPEMQIFLTDEVAETEPNHVWERVPGPSPETGEEGAPATEETTLEGMPTPSL